LWVDIVEKVVSFGLGYILGWFLGTGLGRGRYWDKG